MGERRTAIAAAIMMVLAIFQVLVFAVSPLPAEATTDSTTSTNRACPPQGDGAISVALNGDTDGDGDPKIYASRSEARSQSGPYAINLPAGVYDVYLTSYDKNHPTAPNGQDSESYYIKVSADGVVVWTSTPIRDLGDAEVTLTVRVDQDVELPAVDQVLAIHAAYPGEISNSVEPVCAVFVPKPQDDTTTTSTTSTTTSTTSTTTSTTSTTTSTTSTTQPSNPPGVTPNVGSVTIEKSATGEQGAKFRFSFENEIFMLGDGESKTFQMNTGTYTAREINTEDWALVDITCDDADSAGTVAEAGISGSAAIVLAQGEHVKCVFTNLQVLGIQIESTTTTTTVPPTTVPSTNPPTTTVGTVTVDTLPFTGFESASVAMLAVIVFSMGAGLLLATSRRKSGEDGPTLSGWSNS